MHFNVMYIGVRQMLLLSSVELFLIYMDVKLESVHNVFLKYSLPNLQIICLIITIIKHTILHTMLFTFPISQGAC